MRSRRVVWAVFATVGLIAGMTPAGADTASQALPFSQDWSNAGLITTDDDWAGVPGVVGYRGDDLTTVTGSDPQTITADGSATPVDVIANQTNPNTLATGGVAEFHITNPSVALNGSGTADAPYVVVSLVTSGLEDVTFSYNARDLDASTDDAVQQVATQYRVGATGAYTNLPAGYIADATTGPSLASATTPVAVSLPADANDKPLVQVRVITTNAAGNDEWVGVDDIQAGGNPIAGDAAPAVIAVSPANGTVNVAVDANVEVTFSEPVNVAGSWFEISCATSGSVAATASGGPTVFTLDPDTDLANDEPCTVTIAAAGVSDQDLTDPPDAPADDFSSSFTTLPPPATIAEVQGASHISPLVGENVSGVEGVVTARRTAGGRGVWIQDATPDADIATSDAVFVFLNAAPVAQIGDLVRVSGMVSEFRAGGDPDNLTNTQLTSSNANVTIVTSGNPLPTPTVIGVGGRMPPTENIDDDGAGNVETAGAFDPANDAIDFYESLEGMLLQVNDADVVGATRSFGEIALLPDAGTLATGLRTPRGGILLGGYSDPNPERIIVDDEILRDIAPSPRPAKAMPDMNVGDSLTSAVIGPLDYSFSNYKIQAIATPAFVPAGLMREAAATPTDHQIAVATFNVENLAGTDPQSKYDNFATLIVSNLRSPDIIGIEEVQDNDGVAGGTASPVVDASDAWARLIQAIQSAGGPRYDYRQIDPVDDDEGGAPGGNIRVGFLFRTDRGVEFIDRTGGGPTVETTVVAHPSGPRLSASPGRLGTQSAAFDDTRKSLVGEFRARGKKLFVVVNHFSSKGDDQPLFGPAQPPTRNSELARHGQAQVVHDFVADLLAEDTNANVIVLGDINDFEFSTTVDILEGGGALHSLVKDLAAAERYSYVFEGNSQVLDQILFSPNLADGFPHDYDVVHVNSEFADAVQASDHEPSVARIDLRGPSS
jgi:predicted extracellular nuclease